MALAASACELCLGILTNNEECHFSRSTTCLGHVYMWYDYVHLDNLSDISACLQDVSLWMKNSKLKLNADKTEFLIIHTSTHRAKLNNDNDNGFFPTHILSQFNFKQHISKTCRCCFYHIRDLRRIRRFISLSVTKTIATALVTSRLDYCNSLLYNSTANNDIAKLQRVGFIFSKAKPKGSNAYSSVFSLSAAVVVSDSTQSRIRLNAYRACARMRSDRFYLFFTRCDVVATAYVMPGPRFD